MAEWNHDLLFRIWAVERMAMASAGENIVIEHVTPYVLSEMRRMILNLALSSTLLFTYCIAKCIRTTNRLSHWTCDPSQNGKSNWQT